ncbi:MAG TPA: restriction endonuclease [Fimbriimonadaceae bacterium]|nr:restriction endonuclease [Fimbriimonadaceae bacterium]
MTTNKNGDDDMNSGRNNNSSGSKPNSSSLSYRALTGRVRNLSFVSFQNCVLLWLGAKGYRDICVLKRSAARGRRRVGGADFVAESPHCPSVKVAIQLRHWRTPIQRRAVDELWGFMLRQGIPQGLIVTNSFFYPRAIAAALEFPGRPIRLVSVSGLAGSMAALGLGVDGPSDHPAISESFFRTLDRLRLASSLTSKPAAMQYPTDRYGSGPSGLDLVSTTPPTRPEEPQLWWWLVLGLIVIAFIALSLGLGGYR